MSERDDWIVYWCGAGARRADVALTFGLSRPRVDQIVNAARRARQRELGVLQRALKEGASRLRGCLIASAMGYGSDSRAMLQPVER
jgi:hypothetical protein